MLIDFSQVDTSALGQIAIKLGIFAIVSITVLVVVAGLLTRLKVPAWVVRPVTGFTMIGCLYLAMKYYF